MVLKKIPAVFMRGGTSKAVMFKRSDLPAEMADWNAIFLAVMGSPDPNGRQLDGMGGGLSSVSKICIVGAPSRADADIDYTFAQISVTGDDVDYSGNCGNMSSAIGPFAVEEGIVAAPDSGEALVRIHNTNTGKIIASRFAMIDGAVAAEGDLAIDGVAGFAAPVRLEFMHPGGAKTGRLMPSGRPRDILDVPGLGQIEASLIDAANPCVFVEASTLGKTGTESPQELEGDATFLARMEAIRCAASVAMGLAPDLAAARNIASVPKVAIVAAPAAARTLSGRLLDSSEMSLVIRMISIGQPHRAVPITGAVCLAVAARITGSIPQALSTARSGPIVVAHPSGTTMVDAEVIDGDAAERAKAVQGTVFRTARRLFEGRVLYRPVSSADARLSTAAE